MSPLSLPSFAGGHEHDGTVQVHALSAGHLTLPEEQFVSPSTDGARKTVPSLCFLVQHTAPGATKPTRIVFDLGLRRDVNRYSEPIRRHTETRQPMATDPDVVKSLKAGGLTADDINYVIYSHVSLPCTRSYRVIVGVLWGLRRKTGSLGPRGRTSRFPSQQVHRREWLLRLALGKLSKPPGRPLIL